MTCEYINRCHHMHVDRHHCNNGGGDDCGMWIYLMHLDIQNAAHIKLMRVMIAGMGVIIFIMFAVAAYNVK